MLLSSGRVYIKATLVGLGRRILLVGPANWICSSSVIGLSSNRRIRSSQQRRSSELWEDAASSPPQQLGKGLPEEAGFHGRYTPAMSESTRKDSWLQNEGIPAWAHHRRTGDDIQGFCEGGELDKALDALSVMERQGIVPSGNMYSSLLKACVKKKALLQAKRVEANLALNGLNSTRFLGAYLVSTLVKCGSVEEARQAFDRLPERTVFSWSAIISGYSTGGQGQEALRLYKRMREEGVEPDKFTFVSLLRACGSLSDLEEGKRIHAEAVKFRCDSDLFVGSCLVDMYGKCGSTVDAQSVFDGLSQKNAVSWTAMLAAYAKQGQPDLALRLYDRMMEEGVSPDNRTFVSALQACGLLAEEEGCVVVDSLWMKVQSLQLGKAIHAAVQRKGFELDVFIAGLWREGFTAV